MYGKTVRQPMSIPQRTSAEYVQIKKNRIVIERAKIVRVCHDCDTRLNAYNDDIRCYRCDTAHTRANLEVALSKRQDKKRPVSQASQIGKM